MRDQGEWQVDGEDRPTYECGRFSSLPSAAESVVELHQCEPLIELCLREIELRREVIGFAREYLQEARSAMLVEYFRKTVYIFCGRRQKLLLLTEFAGFLVRDQGVGHLLEGVHDGLLIGQQHFSFLRFGKPHSRADRSPREYGLGQRCGAVPRSLRVGEEV